MTKKSQKSSAQKLTFIQKFGLFFYDRIKTTAAVWLALVVFGILSYTVFMQRQGFPNIAVPISVTTGTYFVNDKAKVDTEVVKPFSELVAKQDSVKSVSSTAADNFYSVVIEYKDGTDVVSAQKALEDKVAQAAFMPASATMQNKPINASKVDAEHDVLLSVRQSPNTDINEVVKAANKIADELKGTSGVEAIDVLNPFKSGVNPATGETVSVQQTFDRVGIRENGQTIFYPSVEIGVIAKSGTDAIHLEKSLNERIDEINGKSENKGTTVAISAGVAESIEEQIHGLQENLLEGLVIVIIISLLLISFRAGVAAALSMATILLITIAGLYVVGITLNTITLFALVLCLGLIVDDITIMAEAIDAGKRSAKSKREIVMFALKKVGRASTAGTLVTMLAFSPMLFIGGILGSFIRVLPITIIMSLAVSLLVSLTLIPFMSRFLLLSNKEKEAESRNPILKLESLVSGGLARLIRIGEHSRKKAAAIGVIAIVVSFGFLMGSGTFFQKLKFDIFPSTKDSNVLGLTINYPAGTDVAEAGRIADDANKILADTLGENLRNVAYLNTGSSQTATATVNLISFNEREVKSPELIKQLSDKYKDFAQARIKVSQLDAGPPKDDFPFRVQIYGEDTTKTDKLVKDMVTYLDGRSVTRTSNKTTSKIIRTQVSGDTETVTRKDGKRLVEVQAGFDSDDISALVTAAQTEVEKEFTESKIQSYGINKSDVTFDFGEESSNQDSFKAMLLAFPVLLLVMYLLLAIQFGSMLQPLLIFTAIPFSFFGVAFGLHITDNPLSFFVMIGFFALIGIAVNNTILLTDFANQARKEGHGGFESMALAVKARFRPLITTSLTSVVALIPLALSDPFWEGLAYTLIFGLLSSTLLVVIAFPYYYLGAEFLRSRYSRRLTIAWIVAIIAAIVAASKVNSKLVPLVFVLAVVTMVANWLKGKFQKRLAK